MAAMHPMEIDTAAVWMTGDPMVDISARAWTGVRTRREPTCRRQADSGV
jgi:hypothetical protein